MACFAFNENWQIVVDGSLMCSQSGFCSCTSVLRRVGGGCEDEV